MVELFAAWLLFPAVLTAVSLGCGLLVERVAGRQLPGILLLPLGFAAVLAAARLLTEKEATAGLALPVLLLLAAAGFVLGFARLRALRPDRLAVLAGLAAFAVFGAPVFLSGEPTFAGYVLLGDTANQLSLAAYTLDHGHDPLALADQVSSYRSAVTKYLTSSYPVASQSALGALAPLGALDPAWLYQPFLTFAAALTSAAAGGLLAPVISSRTWRAAAAFFVATPALAVSYALQGAIKEISSVPMIILCAALVALALRERWPARALITVALAAAAGLGTLGVAGGAFLGPMVLLLLVVWVTRAVREGRKGELAVAAGVILAGVVVALPVLSGAATAANTANVVLSQSGELGNLAGPLELHQAAGIWLNGDYRYAPTTTPHRIGLLLSVLVVLAAAVGVVTALRRRLGGVLIVAGAVIAVGLFLLTRGTPYADAKVLMVMSPAVLACAAVGLWSLRGFARGIPALAVAVVLAFGVLLSNALAYHDAQLAPHGRLAELRDIDERLEGRGPAQLNEYDEFGAYFLHLAPGWNEPEHSHPYVLPPGPTHPERRPHLKMPFDPDDVRADYLEKVPYLVLRRSPVTSRPPAGFTLASRGRWYDVWRRERRVRVLAHQPLGTSLLDPTARAGCAQVRRLARRAERAGGQLAYAERPEYPRFSPDAGVHAPNWAAYAPWPGSLVTAGQGDAQGELRVARPGRYRVWLEGSFGREVEVQVDGRPAGAVGAAQNHPGGFEQAGAVRLGAGTHRIRLSQGGGGFAPGDGGHESSLRHLGTAVLVPDAGESTRVSAIAPARAERLCGRRLDWIAAVSGRT